MLAAALASVLLALDKVWVVGRVAVVIAEREEAGQSTGKLVHLWQPTKAAAQVA